MSRTWIMIDLCYVRVPGTTLYNAELRATQVTTGNESRCLKEKTKFRVEMGDVIRELHKDLQQYPSATVTIVRPKTQEFLKAGRTHPTAVELDENMRDIIRDDLDKAIEMFAPIERSVRISNKPIVVKLSDGVKVGELVNLRRS